ncbi:TPA: hypothetical protein ACN2HO_002507, partial [Staphylococcus aureus]
LNFLKTFYEGLNVEELSNLLQININKSDQKFYRKWIKCNENLENETEQINDVFEKSMIKKNIRDFKRDFKGMLQTPYFLNIVFSFMHMSYNRLGIDNNTEEQINKSIYLYLKEEYYKWKNLRN